MADWTDVCALDDIDPEDVIRFGPFGFRDIVLFGRAERSARVADQHLDRVGQVKEARIAHQQTKGVGRAHAGDFGIAADDDGVGVVAGMAPPPGHGIAGNHEGRDLIDDIVHPVGAKRGAMPAFVPAAVAGGPIHDAVDQPERHRPPAVPEADAAPGRQAKEAEPDGGIAQGGAVAALHQVFQNLARHLCAVPFGPGKTVCLGACGGGSGQGIITQVMRISGNGHGETFLHRLSGCGRPVRGAKCPVGAG